MKFNVYHQFMNYRLTRLLAEIVQKELLKCFMLKQKLLFIHIFFSSYFVPGNARRFWLLQLGFFHFNIIYAYCLTLHNLFRNISKQ